MTRLSLAILAAVLGLLLVWHGLRGTASLELVAGVLALWVGVQGLRREPEFGP